MQSATARSSRYHSALTCAGSASLTTFRQVAPEVFVVSEDEPGQWRVADRTKDAVSGPYPDETSALGVAFDGVRLCNRWEIHVLDQFSTLMSTYTSDEDALHVKVD